MPFSDLEIALSMVGLLACLVAGGALMARQQNQEEANDELTFLKKEAAVKTADAAALQAKCNALESERSEIDGQLEQLQTKCTDACEEAELILLQLHQVQEELEHYFLLSEELQQKLNHSQSLLATVSEADTETPKDQAAAALAHHTSEQVRRVKKRLSSLLQQNPSSTHRALWALLRSQQKALSRFEHLHLSASATNPFPNSSAAFTASNIDSDVVVI